MLKYSGEFKLEVVKYYALVKKLILTLFPK